MLQTLLIVLTLACVLFGVFLAFAPRAFIRVSRSVDKHYSTDGLRKLLDKEISTEKLAELMEKYIDINEKLFQFARVIGILALIVGIFLLVLLLKLY